MLKPVTKISILFYLAVCLALPAATFAASNTATGDVATDINALTDSAPFVINSQQLALIKKAFLAADGTALTSGSSTLARGTKVHFMIYINNRTDQIVANVNIVDQLIATDFVYNDIASGGIFKVTNASAECLADVCTPAEEKARYDAAMLLLNLPNELEGGAEVAGYDAAASPPEVTAGLTAGNIQLDIDPNAVWAMVFEAILQ